MEGLATGPPYPPARGAPAELWRPSRDSDRLLTGGFMPKPITMQVFSDYV